jgi:hypothetical protein
MLCSAPMLYRECCGIMRLALSLQIFLNIIATATFAQTAQQNLAGGEHVFKDHPGLTATRDLPALKGATRNSSVIGLTIQHRPVMHCSNGSERAFWVNVSKQSPEPVPVLPGLTGSLGYPLVLDARGKQLLFSNLNPDPTIVHYSWSGFYGWLDERRSVLVLRGEFPTIANNITECKKVNDVISSDGYTLDVVTNRSSSATVTVRSRSNGVRYDNEGIQPLRTKSGRQVGWIFNSSPPGELLATDMDGWNAALIADDTGHPCGLSPRDPILACQGTGPNTRTVQVLGVSLTILGGSYWAPVWAPDGSGFLNRDDPATPDISYYPIDRTKQPPAVAKPVSVVPQGQGWTPIICCTGDYDPNDPNFGLFHDPLKKGWPFGSALYRWSPDSRWIYYSATSLDRSKTVILRVSVKNPAVFEKLTDKIVLDARYPEPSPDSKYLAFLSTGTDPKPEPYACPAGDKTEWNVQLYTICLICPDKKHSLRQITHLGCNTLASGLHWSQ